MSGMRRVSRGLAIAFSVLAVLTVFFIFQYQNIIATDASQGQIMNQVRLVKVEYNASDPLTIIGTHNPGSFQCNFTINSPTNDTIDLLGISAEYLRHDHIAFYEIAHSGQDSGGTQALNPGNTTFNVRMNYITYAEVPNDTDTTPVFWISIELKRGFSGRIVSVTVDNSAIENKGATARPLQDETYDLLFAYSALAATVWILGLSPLIIAGFAKSGKAKTDRLAACNFLLLTYFIICILMLSRLPYPQPYRVSGYSPPATGGLAGLEILIFLALTGGACLSLLTAIGLFLHRLWGKVLAYLIGALMAVSLLFSWVLSLVFFAFRGVGLSVMWATYALTALTTFTAIIKLATSRDAAHRPVQVSEGSAISPRLL